MSPNEQRTPIYDVAVIGLGVMGLSAVHDLARRGLRVCGFEQFELGHRRGSSHGESRAVRMAYFEGGHYVNLLREAFRLWDDFQGPDGRLFARVGMLEAGFPGSGMVAEVIKSAEAHGLPLGGREVLSRFPQFRLPPDWDVVFEEHAGYLRPDLILPEFARRAAAYGANLFSGVEVTAIEPRASSVIVRMTSGDVEAGAAIVAAGAWMTAPWLRELAPGLATRLRPTRQAFAHFRPSDPEPFRHMPVFGFEFDEGQLFYGFPDLTGSGVKVALHVHGDALDNLSQPVAPAGSADVAPLEALIGRYLRGAVGPAAAETCIYTNSVDGDFLIDRLPSAPNVVLASACSGHGFKFASILGPILADLALGQEERYNEFDIARFAIERRPAFD